MSQSDAFLNDRDVTVFIRQMPMHSRTVAAIWRHDCSKNHQTVTSQARQHHSRRPTEFHDISRTPHRIALRHACGRASPRRYSFFAKRMSRSVSYHCKKKSPEFKKMYILGWNVAKTCTPLPPSPFSIIDVSITPFFQSNRVPFCFRCRLVLSSISYRNDNVRNLT